MTQDNSDTTTPPEPSPTSELDLPPDTPDWVRYRLQQLQARGMLLPEDKLRAAAEKSGVLGWLRAQLGKGKSSTRTPSGPRSPKRNKP